MGSKAKEKVMKQPERTPYNEVMTDGDRQQKSDKRQTDGDSRSQTNDKQTVTAEPSTQPQRNYRLKCPVIFP